MSRLLAAIITLTASVATAAPVCAAPSPLPRVPTLRVGGDSLTLNTCVAGGAGPITTLDANLPGGASGGWLVVNKGVSGSTPAQIRTAYTSDEATACNGERCASLIIEGGVNCLRLGTAPATCLADMTAIVDDALGKGVAVVWLNVTPYAGWGSAGVNPVGQATTYNALWQAECAYRASNALLKCLDNYSAFVDPSNPGFLLPTYSCDGVHYSQVGMNLLASRLQTALLAIPGGPP